MFPLFISEMALKQDNKDLQTQDAQSKEMSLSIAKGKKEMKIFLIGSLTKKHPDNNKDEQLEQLQAEVEEMRIQMLRQMALI